MLKRIAILISLPYYGTVCTGIYVQLLSTSSWLGVVTVSVALHFILYIYASVEVVHMCVQCQTYPTDFALSGTLAIENGRLPLSPPPTSKTSFES